MAGHSHWAGIKHKKAIIDKKRGKLFSRLAKHIMSAARLGGGDPDMNLDLRYAIDKAKEANMPKDNIERAVKKGTGELGGEQLAEILYEGYGPGGVAIMADALTDNRNRTAAEVRNIFNGRGGNLGTTNSVAWMFDRKGMITVDLEAIGEDALMELALENGADNLETTDDSYVITSEVADFQGLREALLAHPLELPSAEITQLPQNYLDVDEAIGEKVFSLLEELDDLDDIQNVFSNVRIVTPD